MNKTVNKKLFRRFLKDFFITYWKKELFVFFLLITDSVFVLLIPYLNKILIDYVLTKKQYQYFYIILGGMVGAYMLQVFTRVIKDSVFFKVGEKILVDIRLRLVKHVLTLPSSFFSKMTTGELLSRIENDVTVLQQVASSAFMELIANIINLVFVLSIMFYLNINLTIISLFIMSTYWFVRNYFGKRTRAKSKEKLNATSKNMSSLSEIFSNIVTVKLFNKQNWAFNKISNLYSDFYNKSITLRKLQIFNVNSTVILTIIAFGSLWLIGGRSILQGTMTLGGLIAFQTYQNRLFSPLRLFSTLNNQIQSASASLERIYDILDQKPLIIDESNSLKLRNIQKGIEFKNVCFSYDKSINVLNNVTFKINPGEFVAFVGQSGCGKSTILKLLTRLYNPKNGEILIDGINIKDYNLKSLREQISIIPQEVQLFKMSIYENLILGNDNISFDDIKKYVSYVDLDKYIEKLSQGYETILDENGDNLSGGQKKRLGIARSLLRDSKILIIDEALNSLDNDRKDKIKEIINKLRGKYTILLISHQLNDIKDADKIFVLENGAITASGKHQILLKQNFTYKELYKKEVC